jgi:hypothetical protein
MRIAVRVWRNAIGYKNKRPQVTVTSGVQAGSGRGMDGKEGSLEQAQRS